MMVKGEKTAATVNPVGDVAPPKKMKGDWESSSTNERHLAGMRANGRLPTVESGKIRCAGNEVITNPRVGEHVAFVDFIMCGLSLPLHEFVRGLPYAYGV